MKRVECWWCRCRDNIAKQITHVVIIDGQQAQTCEEHARYLEKCNPDARVYRILTEEEAAQAIWDVS